MLALLVRVDSLDNGSSQTFHFTRSPVRLGRNPLNDLPLQFPFVSQWHAVVQFDDHQVTFYDLGSTNGTQHQGQRLGKNVAVPVTHPEQDFRIGTLRVTFSRANLPDSMAQQSSMLSTMGGFARPSAADASEHTMIAEGLHPSLGDSAGSTMMLDASVLGLLGGDAPAAGRPPPAAGRPPPAAGRPAGSSGPSGAGRAVAALRPHHAAWRQSWNDLYNALTATLGTLPQAQYAAALQAFFEAYPEAAREAQAVALAESQGVRVPAAPGGADGGVSAQLVAQLAQYLVPGRAPPQTPQEIEGFLVRVLVALETFSTAYVGLRRSHDEFGSEMVGATRRSADPTPLEAGNDPRAVLAYLLDWSADGDARLQSLKGHFAEILTHQVALLSGLMEGVRKLVTTRLSPKEIARQAERTGGFVKFWVFKDAGYWRQYERVHDELTEDKEIAAAVFGREFARAYNAALGENLAESDARRLGSGGGR